MKIGRNSTKILNSNILPTYNITRKYGGAVKRTDLRNSFEMSLWYFNTKTQRNAKFPRINEYLKIISITGDFVIE